MCDLSNHIIIYHGPTCDDGFAAAWIFWDAIKGQEVKDLEFFAAKYGEEPPYELCRGRHVIMVDFSYKQPQIEIIRAHDALSIIILDHHKSAELELKDYPPLPDNWDPVDYKDGATFVRFDMSKSGAMLAWEFVNPHAFPPLLIERIEDNDLWRTPRRYGDSMIVQAALRSYPQDFPQWDLFMYPEGFDRLCKEGTAIRRYIDQKGDELIQQAYELPFVSGSVPFVNCPYAWASEVAGKLAENHPSGMAIAYFIRSDGKVQFSLRSRSDVNVRKMAERYGGGGHDKAAGFELPFHEAIKIIGSV